MSITVFDYGAGNLHSLVKALEAGGARVRVTPDPIDALVGDALVLPGVGAFAPAARALEPGRERVRGALAAGHPCLGICLGMQLLFDGSDEGPGAGLGLVAGRVTRLDATRVPQIGWNALEDTDDDLFRTAPITHAYYANSYACRPDDATHAIAWSRHDSDRFVAAVRRGRTVGVQFHPEKSSRAGVAFVHAWLAEVSR